MLYLHLQQLERSGWFEGLGSEIKIWFSYGEKIKSCDFLEKVLQTLFSNPYPYYDELQTLINQGLLNYLHQRVRVYDFFRLFLAFG